jgi:hypothetical protein
MAQRLASQTKAPKLGWADWCIQTLIVTLIAAVLLTCGMCLQNAAYDQPEGAEFLVAEDASSVR